MIKNIQSCFVGAVLFCAAIAGAQDAKDSATAPQPSSEKPTAQEEKKLETITLGSGCFWCTEAVFQRIKGIETAKSGYSGGHVKNPTYKAVCNGETGHAEVIQITYDPAVASTRQVIELFFEQHDPTTLNRQGADVGTQYRSAIYYHTEEQRQVAEEVKKSLDASGKYKSPIVTEITKFDVFYPAEDYHQNFYNQNSENGYCRAVITPKLKKLGLEKK